MPCPYGLYVDPLLVREALDLIRVGDEIELSSGKMLIRSLVYKPQ